MLREIFLWWLRQIWSLAPSRLKRGKTARDATIVAVDTLGDHQLPASGVVLMRRAGQESVIGTLRSWQPIAAPQRRSLPTGLRLPEATVLHRDVVLPLAAERNLTMVLDYEMDRLTPFDAGEVFWGVGGLRRDPVHGLRLTLIVVLRAPVQRLLEALGRVNLTPSFLETASGRIELAASSRSGFARQGPLYGLCAVLALLCVAIPLLRQQAALDQASRRIAALAPTRLEAARLRHDLAAAASGQAAVTAAQRNGDPLQILAALTAALPDDTSLSDLTLTSGDVVIDGQSSDAAGLIARLTAASPFLDPQFVAPVTRATDGQSELFSIHMSVAP